MTLGQTFFVIKQNPRCSLSCCLFLFLTINEAGNEMMTAESNKGLSKYQNKLDFNFELDLTQTGLSVELEKEIS
jgi:hypothetical protein